MNLLRNLETQVRKTFHLPRNVFLVEALDVWQMFWWSSLVPHPTQHSPGLATRGLGHCCPKLWGPGLRSSMTLREALRGSITNQQPDPLQREQNMVTNSCVRVPLEMCWVSWNWQFREPHFISQRGKMACYMGQWLFLPGFMLFPGLPFTYTVPGTPALWAQFSV